MLMTLASLSLLFSTHCELRFVFQTTNSIKSRHTTSLIGLLLNRLLNLTASQTACCGNIQKTLSSVTTRKTLQTRRSGSTVRILSARSVRGLCSTRRPSACLRRGEALGFILISVFGSEACGRGGVDEMSCDGAPTARPPGKRSSMKRWQNDNCTATCANCADCEAT